MTVSLAKGESLSLKKDNGSTIRNVTIGLGWDEASKKGLFAKLKGGGDIDLDASVIMFNGSKKQRDLVFFNSLKSKDGSIVHTGDNLTGEGDGDDEQIIINLEGVASDVEYLAIVITSYSGQTFNQVENVFCRVVDNDTKQEIVRYDLREQGKNTAQIMAVFARRRDAWEFKAVGSPANAKTPHKLVENVAAII